MKKRDRSSYFDGELEHKDDLEDEGNFSGPGITEFSLDLDTDKLRNMSPDELDRSLFLHGLFMIAVGYSLYKSQLDIVADNF